MLDYAANSVVYLPAEKLRALYEARCDEAGEDPADALRTAMGRDDLDVDEYWRRVETNLQARRMRLIFVADEIPAELRRVVEYLNAEMANTDVLAVEIKQFVGADLRTLVPTLIGDTAAAAARKGVRTETRQWDEASFFSDLEARRGGVEAAVVRRLFAWAREQGLRLYFGKGATTGSFVPTYDGKDNSYWLTTFWTNGQVEMAFQWLRLRPPFDQIEMRQNLLERLNAIPGVSLPADSLDRRPSFMLDAFGTNPNSADALIGVYEWMIERVTQAGHASHRHDVP
jgi:hypothetical protein